MARFFIAFDYKMTLKYNPIDKLNTI